MVDLKLLKIPVLFNVKDWDIYGYKYISVDRILQTQNAYCLAHLRDWFSDQFLRYLGWPDCDVGLTEESVRKGLDLMEKLNIKPTDFFYGEDDETDEPL